MKKGQITKEKVIRQAMNLIHTKGVGSTSMNDIIAATGVKKGNLYFHFTTKEELAVQAIEEARRHYTRYLASSLTGDSALEKLENLIDAIVAFHKKRKVRGGCIFGNTAIETGGKSSPLTVLIRKIFSEWADQIEDLTREALDAKDGKAGPDPAALAKTIISTLEGAIMMAKLTGRVDDLSDCSDTLKQMIRCVMAAS
ncbi:MAG TPA: TetR/AcrR family transcriptional regulator [Spirochaetota bacterium]|nr:TetR/AcrR family transcriptional regulator [Spirochaetota bacterium]HRZ29027.1 TetR/AcrR family transcriptional regulator [Spirochaetota bacterium]HSA13685.1 TetR/AcrR family transcriptional regulator [Spirochaetota bacterium]